MIKNIFSNLETHTHLVGTTLKSIEECAFSFHAIMIRDQYHLKTFTFGCSENIQLKGGENY